MAHRDNSAFHEDQIEDLYTPVANAKVSYSDEKSCKFEVIVDERKNATEEKTVPKFHENFFYDEKLFSLLGCRDKPTKKDEVADIGTDDDMEPFERMARNMEDLTGNGGVMKKIVKPGLGPVLVEGTVVRFHYSCYLEYSDEPVGSTHFRSRLHKSKIGSGDVLPGLGIGLATMRLHETSHFLLSPDYAYGKLGCRPIIPPESWLLIEVKLESAVDCSLADQHSEKGWDWQKQDTATYSERMELAKSYHRKGNDCYLHKKLTKARSCYQQAIWLLEESPLSCQQERHDCNLMIAKLHSNIAKIALDLEQMNKVCDHCKMALEMDFDMPNDLKAKIYFRYGKAKLIQANYSDARKLFLYSQKLQPNCPDLKEEMKILTEHEKKELDSEKELSRAMMGAILTPKGARPVETKNSDLVKECLRREIRERLQEKQTTGVTVSGGVSIVEIDSEDGGANSEGEESDEEEIHPLVKKLKPEFVDIALSEIDRLEKSSKAKEILFPANLSLEEITFISSIASNRNFKVHFQHRGNSRLLKVVKTVE